MKRARGGSTFDRAGNKKVKTRRQRRAGRGAGIQRVQVVNSVTPMFRQIAAIPLPKKLRTSVRYCENTTALNPGVGGVVASHLFAANGLYDPNITGTGHQPLGFDQLMAMYTTYTVISSKIWVVFDNAEATYPMLVGINVNNGGTPMQAIRAIEQGEGVWAALTPRGDSKTQVELTKSFSLRAQNGGRVGIPEYAGSSATNPTGITYFNVWADPNSGVDTSAANFTAVIDYFVEFNDAKELAQS